MLNQLLSPFSLLLIFLYFTITCAQSLAQARAQVPPPPTVPPPALALAPLSNSPNNIAILQKANKFSKFLHLLKVTQMANQINVQLSKSQGLTIFAPADDAFGDLKSGTLNSLTGQQQVELMQFHGAYFFLWIRWEVSVRLGERDMHRRPLRRRQLNEILEEHQNKTAHADLNQQGLNLYRQMLRSGDFPDAFTFPFAVKSCADLSLLVSGAQLHGHVFKIGCENGQDYLT
uniref:Putative fasciclin-like arabinogalactan protein 11 n=1 Tax=Davidia involucrata TaxID=16924 RepID=A0A5B7BRR6_DAVIN